MLPYLQIKLELETGIYAVITPRMHLTLPMIVDPRTSSPFSSGFLGFLLLYRDAHRFVAFSYASALQTMALFGLNFERFPAMIGMLTFLVVSVFQLFRVV
jgi:hypothetical protein